MAQEIADSTLLDTWASGGNIVEPDISKIIEGWQLGEQPPHEYMNWLQNTFGSKLNHILKNGVPAWNNTTQYLAGSTVQHSGNVWLCKATNTNSAPTDANANWKRIITVEALDGLLNGYVDTTTNQTIAGVKTFSSNPISSATQSTATNALTRKDYVDGLNSTAVKLTGDQTIAGVKTFSSSPIIPTPTSGTQAANKDYADTKITLATANSHDIGVNQTWQDVKASRSAGVTYTNTTGKPIMAIIQGNTAGSNIDKTVYIDDVAKFIFYGDLGSANRDSITFIIPNGSTYKITGSLNIQNWQELR